MSEHPDFGSIQLLALDFDGVLTDNKVIVSQDGVEHVVCDRSDGYGIQKLREYGVDVVVITRETNPVVEKRCTKLKIPCIKGVLEKKGILEGEVKQRGLSYEDVCFIGNDTPDIECAKAAGIGVCVADGYEDVKEIADYVTQKKGGCGAVREVCDLIIKAKTGNG